MGIWTGTAFPAERVATWTTGQTPVVWTLTTLYVFIAFFGPGRVPVVKHGLLPTWYRCNGIFQLSLLLAFLPEMCVVLSNGWTESVCRNGSLYQGSFSGSIVLLFVLSKVVDLAETALIVLEGRRPLKMHILHHALTLLYTWHSYAQQHSVARWFVFVNLLAHVVLYSYLSPRKFGLSPCWLLVCTTQMLQLVVFLLVAITAENVIARGGQCDVDSRRLPFDKLISALFIVIFADFYHGKWREFRASRVCAMADPDELRSEKTTSTYVGSTRTSYRNSVETASRNGWQKTGITPSEGGYYSN